MKLLFDANLSPKLVESLRDVFPESEHVAGAGLGTAADSAVWEFAAEREMIIVSKDEDFHQLAFLKGLHRKLSGSGSATARLPMWRQR